MRARLWTEKVPHNVYKKILEIDLPSVFNNMLYKASFFKLRSSIRVLASVCIKGILRKVIINSKVITKMYRHLFQVVNQQLPLYTHNKSTKYQDDLFSSVCFP